MSVTWKLKKDVIWSDGEPFTADDVKFTYSYIADEATAATTAGNYAVIDSVEAVDPNTVKINFKDPTPGWYGVFCGSYGYILPQHILKDSVGAEARNAPFNLKPVGTGAYKVDEFQSGDHVSYSINDKFRDPDKPYFKTVYLKGGGDAPSAARAAIQTGEVDYSWNLQVEWGVLQSLKSDSNPGELVIVPGTGVERILVNMTDPNKDVNGEKSSLQAPHPFQSDLKVRQAYALGIQRDVMATQLYGDTGTATSNILVAPTAFASPNTSWKFDVDAANKLLDDAGWTKNGSVREKDGVQTKIVYQTSVNSLRQKEQEIVKQGYRPDRCGGHAEDGRCQRLLLVRRREQRHGLALLYRHRDVSPTVHRPRTRWTTWSHGGVIRRTCARSRTPGRGTTSSAGRTPTTTRRTRRLRQSSIRRSRLLCSSR